MAPVCVSYSCCSKRLGWVLPGGRCETGRQRQVRKSAGVHTWWWQVLLLSSWLCSDGTALVDPGPGAIGWGRDRRLNSDEERRSGEGTGPERGHPRPICMCVRASARHARTHALHWAADDGFSKCMVPCTFVRRCNVPPAPLEEYVPIVVLRCE